MIRNKNREKTNLDIRRNKDEIKQRVNDYLVRAHSFQEVGTEVLPDENYDVLHFPHIILAIGVIMGLYGYFIIYISSEYTVYLDGLSALIVGNIISTIGMLRLLKKYWTSFVILLLLSFGIIALMLAIWIFILVPWGLSSGLFLTSLGSQVDFLNRVMIIIQTTLMFAYTACFVWYIFARYTSSLYFRLYSGGKKKRHQFFIVDPWRKTLSNKMILIKDILGRILYPFLFLLSIMLSVTNVGELYFTQIDWDNYFQSILVMYALLCVMVVIFPALWLLDYVRFYDEHRLEVRSMGRQVLFLVKGYAGFGIIISFLARSQDGIISALMELFILTLYLIPTLILLIGGYVLLTERDVYYIASKVPHGDVVIVNYKLIDSLGEELRWWLAARDSQSGGEIKNE